MFSWHYLNTTNPTVLGIQYCYCYLLLLTLTSGCVYLTVNYSSFHFIFGNCFNLSHLKIFPSRLSYPLHPRFLSYARWVLSRCNRFVFIPSENISIFTTGKMLIANQWTISLTKNIYVRFAVPSRCYTVWLHKTLKQFMHPHDTHICREMHTNLKTIYQGEKRINKL